MPKTGSRSRPQETLPYRVELADLDTGGKRILARAVNVQLARAIFRAATGEHPGSRITLRRGSRIIADSQTDQSGATPPLEANG
jgi:hypothetical protein